MFNKSQANSLILRPPLPLIQEEFKLSIFINFDNQLQFKIGARNFSFISSPVIRRISSVL